MIKYTSAAEILELKTIKGFYLHFTMPLILKHNGYLNSKMAVY